MPDGTLEPHPNDTEADRRDLAKAKEIIARVEKMRRGPKRQEIDDLRDTLGPRAGPADLRNSVLNANRELREVMRPQAGPSDLRNSRLNQDRDVRGQMRQQVGP